MAELQSPSLWYDHYEGAVYDLDLEAEPCCDGSPKLKSLMSICCKKIVSDSTMAQNAVALLPRLLVVPLMQEALLCNNDRAVNVLLTKWPYSSIVLRDLVPQPFTSLTPLYNQAYQTELVRQGMRYTTTLAHTLMEALKKNQTRLNHLDLTGFPTAELMLLYVSSHCLLMFNEMRQDCMINLYQKSLERGKVQAEEPLDLELSFPQDLNLSIKMDAFVSSESTLRELCRALKVSTFDTSRMRLYLSRLSVTCLGEPSINIILSLVNPEYLTGLQIRYNGLGFQELRRLTPNLRKLRNLTSLDLSSNKIHLWNNHLSVDIITEAVSCLPSLTRLDFSSNCLKTRLRVVLGSLPRPLTYLRLASCRLAENDLDYLADSHHLATLQELDLSDNALSAATSQLARVVTGLQGQVRVLELEECYLSDSDMLMLLPHFGRLQQLLYLNVANSKLHGRTLTELVRTLAKLPRLKALKVSHSQECYGENATEEEEEAQKAEEESLLYQSLETVRRQVADTSVKLVLVDYERPLQAR